MSTTLLPPFVAAVPTPVALQTINQALTGIFKHTLFLHCENQVDNDDESVIVIMGNGICATVHVQTMANAITQEGGVA